jgi:hypothetical protein
MLLFVGLLAYTKLSPIAYPLPHHPSSNEAPPLFPWRLFIALCIAQRCESLYADALQQW